MTVSVQVPEVQLVGNGTTTLFAFNFELTTGTDIAVYVGGTLAVLNVDFTLGSFTTSGGTITFANAPANGVVVTITRDLPLSRAVDYQPNGSFDAVDVNSDFDRLWLGLQQQQLQLAGSISVPTFDTPANLTLPVVATRANQFLTFDSSGNVAVVGGTSGGIAISPAMTPVVQATTLSAALALIGVNTKLANNLGTVAASVPDGTTIVGIGYTTDQGSAQKLQVNGNIYASGSLFLAAPAGTGTNGGAVLTSSSVNGVIVVGQGSANDVALQNKSSTNVLTIPTGTTNVAIGGNLTVGGNLSVIGTGLTKKFTSGQTAIPVAGATASVPHSLGAAPFGYQIYLQCLTANLGYAIGDTVQMGTLNGQSASGVGLAAYADATNVYVIIGSGGGIDLVTKTTGVLAATVVADWAIIVKAWLF